ncbi:hypothetical protein BH23ACT10_BH23ACT10_25490 [soil metagenome]
MKTQVAAVAVGLVLAGCASVDAGPAAAPTEQGRVGGHDREQMTVTPSTPEAAAQPSPPPVPPLYEPTANEVYPNAKRVAAAVAHTLTNYGTNTDLSSIVAVTTTDRDRRQAVRKVAKPLYSPDRWSRGRVVYPQLGGVAGDRVSVMVVVEQRTGTANRTAATVTRTMDIRLVLAEEEWVLDKVASVGGTATDRPRDLPAQAVAVVDDPRIALPESARWDIYRGDISTKLLRVMAALADRTPYEVVTLSSGHPYDVFGTDRQSNHTKGRAVDIYVFDNTRVIDDRGQRSTARQQVDWLFRRPALSELGSPWALDGYGGRSFADVIHEDHVHVGVRG